MRLPSICLIGCINKCGWQRAAEMKHDLLILLHGNSAAATPCLPAAINVNTCMQLLQHQPHHDPGPAPTFRTGKWVLKEQPVSMRPGDHLQTQNLCQSHSLCAAGRHSATKSPFRVHASLTIAFILRPLRAKHQADLNRHRIGGRQAMYQQPVADARLPSCSCSLGSIERQPRSHGVHRVRQHPHFAAAAAGAARG